jgi:predicted metal-dependent enzyme (double-stranded beta helix superfamily)
MTHTVSQLATEFRSALKAEPGPAGRQQVCKILREALTDQDFIEATFDDNTPERKILHEDPELGFCILAHQYKGPKESSPHDHAHSWAIYGQVAGETMMSDWDLVSPASAEKPGKVKHKKKYSLTPGVAHVYNEGDLHSPSRVGPTRLIRIEGTNMEKVKRHKFEPV